MPDVEAFDIVIVGGGIVGLSLASELANSDFTVAIVERNKLGLVTGDVDCRVSAINRFALKQFEKTGVFDSSLSERMCAFEKMFVWDQTGAGQIEFDSAEMGVPELGAIIENKVLQTMLLDVVQAADNITYFCPEDIVEINYKESDSEEAVSQILLSSGKKLITQLLVGADGVNSKVRATANIQQIKKSYQQQGLVCNVRTSESHQNTAWQCFMPSGPLAFLPLFNGECSIVWSLDESEAKKIMTLNDDSFKNELAAAAEFKLGEIIEVSQRFLFPLSHSHVNEYVKPGLALIGDAAHSIHPLAGQGANLGIADAIALAEIIGNAKQANRQWAALHTLKKYQRQRKGANQLMEASMTGFKELFGNKNSVLSEVRNAGLSLVDHLPALKYKIIQQAIG
jgi:2-octaprenylphenol hydroxylase